MKKATLLAISFMIVAVTCMSFSSSSVNSTAGNTKKPFLQQTFYYKAGTEYQRLQPGHDAEIDLVEQTIAEWMFTDPYHWSTTDTNQQSGNGTMDDYIYAITFNYEWLAADGSNDGEVTLQEALNILWDKFSYNNAMPQSTLIGVGPGTWSYITVTASWVPRY